jgi:tripartite-type tricarboxylate transporter receptor subunit TctC
MVRSPASTPYTRRQVCTFAIGAACATAFPIVRAQRPARPQARILCGFPPGDPIDTLARRFADQLRGTYADVVIVDNKPGAGGRIAAGAMRGAPADGSVLLFTPASMLVVYPHVYRHLPYDSLRDVVPVSQVTQVNFAFAVGPMVPPEVRTLAQFLDWCKAHPSQASYGASGQGSSPHLTAALLSKLSGVPMTMVPYRGGLLAVTDVMSGQVAAAVTTHPLMVPHHQAGKLRVLAISSASRLAQLPDVPTFAESGFPQLVTSEWFGVFLPAGTQPAIAGEANAAIRAAAATQDVANALAGLSLPVVTSELDAFQQQFVADHDLWGRIVQELDIPRMD